MRKAFIMVLCIIAMFAIVAANADAAGRATWTVINAGRFMVYRCAWTSDSSGAVSATADVKSVTITGFLTGVNFKSVSGSVPTTAYDVTLLNADGKNILYDASASVNSGADVPSAVDSTGQSRTPRNADGGLKQLYNEVLTPAITNAGDTKSGVIELIIW